MSLYSEKKGIGGGLESSFETAFCGCLLCIRRGDGECIEEVVVS